MSATGAWSVPARAFEARLAELKAWRDATAAALAAFRRWAVVGRVLDEQSAARLAHLERRLASERLTVSFVGEFSRGKSELINALFFADTGTRLLPSGLGRTTLCPIEVRWDEAQPPALRLLPIETRESPRALREFMADPAAWKEVPLDAARPDGVAEACQAIAQTINVAAGAAASLGLASTLQGRVDIPKWRYAVLNYPHPLLAAGLTILDTPGHNAMGTEPEVTMHRIPDSAAIVFMLGADTGVTATDKDLWNEHIAPIQGLEQTCYVVLNKIDGLRDGMKPEAQVLAEIDRQVRASAEALGVPPMRVFGLSARQGLVGKVQDDRDLQVKSRLYRLEQALAGGMVHQRRVDHAAAVRAELRSVWAEGGALLDSRLAFARQQVEEITELQGRNQKLVETLARKASAERVRLEQARAVMMGLRTIHNRHADELARLLDPNAAREQGIRTRLAVLNSAFSSSIGVALDQFFDGARNRIRESVAIIGEARGMMQTVARKFTQEYQIAAVEAPEFATDRFLVELDRLQALCARDFKGTGSLLLRRRSTLGALFFDTVALKVIHVFEIADREVRTWLNGFIRPLEAHLAAFQEQTNARIEGMSRIQNAEVDLVERLAELRSLAAEVAAQREQWDACRERLEELLQVEPEHSLA